MKTILIDFKMTQKESSKEESLFFKSAKD